MTKQVYLIIIILIKLISECRLARITWNYSRWCGLFYFGFLGDVLHVRH
nr:MAG TPA: hypothetical protein [Bacteriophage sp.]